jgi:hypothetical protein
MATWVVAGSAAAQLRPLSSEHARIVEAIPDENTEPPGEHYYRSNEWRQDLLRPHLADLGGAFVGVGADQNYTMAAMAGSELLVLVDYDPFIPWIHQIYGVLIREAATPEELIARFADENEAETVELLRSSLASHPRLARMMRHFRGIRRAWHAYLERVQGLVRDGQPFSWLSSPELYAHVRGLFLAGRVIARNGDVTGTETMRAVGDACRRLGVTVRVVYFSNAEQFFEYTDGFIANMHALPSDDRTIALRTMRHRSVPNAVDGQWHWLVHDYDDFLGRLDTGVYRRSFAFTADLLAVGDARIGPDGLSTMDAAIPRAMLELARERRARRESRPARAAMVD